MLDPDYLKIDQSKLPLEIFDNIEFEQADLPPSEWLASRSNGKAPYFINGKWLWRPVEILGTILSYLLAFLLAYLLTNLFRL